MYYSLNIEYGAVEIYNFVIPDYAPGSIKANSYTGLFYNKSQLAIAPIYDWMLKDELAVCGYWTGHYQESFEPCLELLVNKNIVEENRKRITKNRDLAQSMLSLINPMVNLG